MPTTLQCFRALAALTSVILVVACGSHANFPTTNLSGKVVDINGAIVGGATIKSTSGSTTSSDANGNFHFDETAEELGTLVASSPAHSTAATTLSPGIADITLTLRAYDLVQSFTVPTGAAATQNFSVTGASATKITVGIPPNSLVDAAGHPASGAANFKMSFWDPNNDVMDGRPAALLAHSPNPADNDVINTMLDTYGMFEVTLEQNGNDLQIASGSNISVAQVIPPELGNFYMQEANTTSPSYLWYLDPNTGAWRLEDDMSFDANTNTMSAMLPHLSTWNFDVYSNVLRNCNAAQSKQGLCTENTVDFGGCLQGTITDKNGKPIVGKADVFLFDSEAIYEYTVTTDSSGHFCGNLGVRGLSGSQKKYIASNTVPFYTSAYANMSNSSMRNPAPAHCQKATYPWSKNGGRKWGGGFLNMWNKCKLVVDDFDPSTKKKIEAPVAPFTTATIYTCAYCPGTEPKGGCPVPGYSITNKCAQGGGNIVSACSTVLSLASACDASNAHCCPAGTSCFDGQCVPATDTSVKARALLNHLR